MLPGLFVVFCSNSQTTVPQHAVIQAWDCFTVIFNRERMTKTALVPWLVTTIIVKLVSFLKVVVMYTGIQRGLFSKRQVKVTLGVVSPYLELPANMWPDGFLHTFQHKKYPGTYSVQRKSTWHTLMHFRFIQMSWSLLRHHNFRRGCVVTKFKCQSQHASIVDPLWLIATWSCKPDPTNCNPRHRLRV